MTIAKKFEKDLENHISFFEIWVIRAHRKLSSFALEGGDLETATRLLIAVMSVPAYIKKLEELKKVAHGNRRHLTKELQNEMNRIINPILEICWSDS